MKKLFRLVLVAVCFSLAMSVVSCDRHNTDTPEVTPAKYTIMLYGCGGGNVDNQLEDALEGAVQALGVDNNQVSYTVMYFMSANASKEDFPDTFRGERGKTYRYVLSKDESDYLDQDYRDHYTASAFDQATLWSKWLD